MVFGRQFGTCPYCECFLHTDQPTQRNCNCLIDLTVLEKEHHKCDVCGLTLHADDEFFVVLDDEELQNTHKGAKFSITCKDHRKTVIENQLNKQSEQLSLKARFAILHRDKFTCQYCGRKAPAVVIEVDHIIPKSKGGLTYPSNLTAACFECNRGKKDKII